MVDPGGDLPRPRAVRLDFTALVDVVFLLLIFFMVSTTFQEGAGMDLKLPQASSASQSDADELRVRLDDAGGVYFKESRIDVAALEVAARAALAATERKTFVVEADARVAHGQVVKVMDALRRAGARGLTIATDEVAGSGATDGGAAAATVP